MSEAGAQGPFPSMPAASPLLLFASPWEACWVTTATFPCSLEASPRVWNYLPECLPTSILCCRPVQASLSGLRKPLCGLARSPAASRPPNPSRGGCAPPSSAGRLEVSGWGQDKVKSCTAGKATQRACPTDPQSAARKRHCRYRERCPSGWREKARKIKQGMNPTPRQPISSAPGTGCSDSLTANQETPSRDLPRPDTPVTCSPSVGPHPCPDHSRKKCKSVYRLPSEGSVTAPDRHPPGVALAGEEGSRRLRGT